ncbi:MAG TPA: sialidase family protein [Pirellulales bacterium]|nr:sialidase family protein [Pirellulales bacterium]
MNRSRLAWLSLLAGMLAGFAPRRGMPLEPLPDLALQPPAIVTSVGPEYGKDQRGAQGVPGIERAPGGRLWAAWYTGKAKNGVESPTSYCVLVTSDDDGRTWSDLNLVIQPRRFTHTYDPCLWLDPTGRLWLFWAQSAGMQDGRMGVWAITTTEPDSEHPAWTPPRRIANGIMLNKPTVLANGDWLLCVGLWRENTSVPNVQIDADDLKPYTVEMLKHDLGDERGSNVYRSSDQGKTFQRIGQVRVPGTRVDEHMIVERRDGSLWMLLRNLHGIAQSTSADGGRTWSEGSMFMTGRAVASKRFFVRRLSSGALLLVRNNSPNDGSRTHMTAFVSDDDGRTWQGGLLLEEGESSYPDGTQAPEGSMYVIYDHQRYTLTKDGRSGAGAIALAKFTEADVRAGRPASDGTRLRIEISRLR